MKNISRVLLQALLSAIVAGICALLVIILYTNAKLPSVKILEDIQLQVPLKIYTADKKLIAEYGEKRRTPIDIETVPELFVLAILATEDRRFFEHNGVDLRGLARATVHMLTHGNKSQGASTITMQVARNFFLTRKKTFSRKLNEMLLAVKIEKELSKEKILELYLNKIYFGKRAYGVAAAADVYYGTTVENLTLAQIAMIAGLPQAPSAINPLNNRAAAIKRRNHVLSRMHHYGFIDDDTFQTAQASPLTAKYHGRRADFHAPYIAEMARQALVKEYGKEVYTLGLEAYTTIDSRLQTIAQQSLKTGLMEYDVRHGYRGPIDTLDVSTPVETLVTTLQKKYPQPAYLSPGIVMAVHDKTVDVLLPNGETIALPMKGIEWARAALGNKQLGPKPKQPADVLSVGDVIYTKRHHKAWALGQLPDIGGALVALSPEAGAIKALVGGYDFRISSFNRATQAKRQSGSNFKPFIYGAALEHGFTAASIINDAPVVYKDDNLETEWRPQNDNRRFYGPTRLRVGLTKSRNLVSIRLLQTLGLGNARNVLERFGFNRDNLPAGLSLALGTITMPPIDVAAGYAAFANGGYKVSPYLIEKIVDGNRQVVFEHEKPIEPTQAISSQTAYIMTTMLQDAIQTGTGRRAKSLHRPDLAGKTGTTNNKLDAWYTGYNQDIVATAWVGYDDNRSTHEYGSQAALPIWIKFMQGALAGSSPRPFIQPPGLVTVRIDPATGLLARAGQGNAIFELFTADTVPIHLAPAKAPKGSLAITPNASNAEESLF